MKIKILFLSFLLLLFSCKESDVSVDYGSIRGKVYDGETYEPLSGVQISTTPFTSVLLTNQNGDFVIPDVPPGEYKLKAEKNGYYSKELGIRVLSNKQTQVDFFLNKRLGSGTDTTENPNDTDTSGQNLDKTLVLFYKFNNNVKDDSKYKIDGIERIVQYVKDRKGENNQAIEFFGNSISYVDVPFNPLLNLSTFSYSFWINPNNGFGTPDNSGYIDLISRWGHWGPNTTSFAFSLRQDGTFCVLFYKLNNQSNYGASENYYFVYSTKKVEVGKWTHIVVTHNQQTGLTRIFINGELDIEKYTFTPQSSNVYGLRLGNRIDVTQTFYNGKMDDLKIFARELTEDEIKQLFEE